MAYGVVVLNQVQATNIDTLNRSAVYSADVENGSVMSLTGISATPGVEVWASATPATASLTNLWMTVEPEVVTISVNGKKFKGLSNDPRDFVNLSGDVFTVFKPQVGDIITLSSDAVAGTKSSNGYVVATNNAAKLTWAASAVSGLSLKLLETTYISIADGTIGTQRQTAYKFEVVAIA
jgi:hypothetical protein